MIIELVGSTCYSAILYQEPVGIDELKPYILRTVRGIMAMHRTAGRAEPDGGIQHEICKKV